MRVQLQVDGAPERAADHARELAALGVDGARATTPDEFRIALQNALATGRSTIVNVMLE